MSHRRKRPAKKRAERLPAFRNSEQVWCLLCKAAASVSVNGLVTTAARGRCHTRACGAREQWILPKAQRVDVRSRVGLETPDPEGAQRPQVTVAPRRALDR